jgi:hypothetical protein
MKILLDLINLIPKELQIGIACLVIGGVAFAGLETRYMTVSDYTKSYVLDLKKAIREIQNDLRDLNLTERERLHLEMELQELIDELCYERPDDKIYCDFDDHDA